MSRENPSWGAPRIHDELLKLGIPIGDMPAAITADSPPLDLLGVRSGFQRLLGRSRELDAPTEADHQMQVATAPAFRVAVAILPRTARLKV
jgi:hypothetical protein